MALRDTPWAGLWGSSMASKSGKGRWYRTAWTHIALMSRRQLDPFLWALLLRVQVLIAELTPHRVISAVYPSDATDRSQ